MSFLYTARLQGAIPPANTPLLFLPPRKRSKGMNPADYNKGSITTSGLIRCSCHGTDITMSEFEQHSNSQIHRPAEYIFIRSIDMSLKVRGGVCWCIDGWVG